MEGQAKHVGVDLRHDIIVSVDLDVRRSARSAIRARSIQATR